MNYLPVLLGLFLCFRLSTQDPMRHFHGAGKPGRIFEECSELSGVTYEDLENLRRSEEARAKLANGEGDFRNVGCFFACMHQKRGLMTGNTFVRQERLHDDDNEEPENSYISERKKQFKQILEDCMDTAEGVGDECEVALALKVCMEKSWPPPPLS